MAGNRCRNRGDRSKLIYYDNDVHSMLDYLGVKRNVSVQTLITEALNDYVYKNIIQGLDMKKILKEN